MPVASSLLLFCALLALAVTGCTPHQAPDAALVSELRIAALATFTAMGLSEDQQPGEREHTARIALVATHADRQRVAAVRAGSLDERHLRDDFHAALSRRRPGMTMAPPDLLSALDRATVAWTLGQALLFDALLAQYQRESGLERPPPELATGAR